MSLAEGFKILADTPDENILYIELYNVVGGMGDGSMSRTGWAWSEDMLAARVKDKGAVNDWLRERPIGAELAATVFLTGGTKYRFHSSNSDKSFRVIPVPPLKDLPEPPTVEEIEKARGRRADMGLVLKNYYQHCAEKAAEINLQLAARLKGE